MAGCSEADVVEMFYGGMARSRIARDCDCSRETVDRILAARGARVPDVPAALAASLVDLYRHGVAIYALAREHDLSEATVTLVLIAAGVPIAKPGRRPIYTPYGQDAAQIRELYAKGGVAAVEELLRCSRSTAYRRYRIATGRSHRPSQARAKP